MDEHSFGDPENAPISYLVVEAVLNVKGVSKVIIYLKESISNLRSYILIYGVIFNLVGIQSFSMAFFHYMYSDSNA